MAEPWQMVTPRTTFMPPCCKVSVPRTVQRPKRPTIARTALVVAYQIQSAPGVQLDHRNSLTNNLPNHPGAATATMSIPATKDPNQILSFRSTTARSNISSPIISNEVTPVASLRTLCVAPVPIRDPIVVLTAGHPPTPAPVAFPSVAWYPSCPIYAIRPFTRPTVTTTNSTAKTASNSIFPPRSSIWFPADRGNCGCIKCPSAMNSTKRTIE